MLVRRHPFYPVFQKLILGIKHRKTIDLGTSKRFAKEMEAFRSEFDDYYAAGYRPDKSLDEPCDFDEDIRALSFPDKSFAAAICLEVLEHVFEFENAIQEIYRILENGGELILSLPFMTGYHGRHMGKISKSFIEDSSHEGYSDYFRFSHEALFKLFYGAGFRDVAVMPVDGPLLARLETMLPRSLSRSLYPIVRYFDRPQLGKMTTRHFVYAIK